MNLQGLHHVTLICADAPRNCRFYVKTLGLRLVKKTVNYDDPSSYHLYFGDALGRPGTLVTFFEWPGAPRGAVGVGGTHHVALTVDDPEGLLRWKRRLADLGLGVAGPYNRGFFQSIYFTDPDGVILEVATRGPALPDAGAPLGAGAERDRPAAALLRGQRDEAAIAARTWHEPVTEIDEGMRLRGLHHVSAIASDLEATAAFYRDVLGHRVLARSVDLDDPETPHDFYATGDGGPGTLITYFGRARAGVRRMRMGAGVTHHFAFAVEDEAEQLACQEALMAAGVRVTPVMDRTYFKSVYFQDPDGHILEIATAGPGFTADESAEALGSMLALPRWLEPQRPALERTLKPVG